MANDAMREHWTGGADGWVEHQELFDAELAKFADKLLAIIRPDPSSRVLDVGCGTGVLLERATEAGAKGVGVDISPAMVTAASARVPAATFVVADAQTEDLAALGPFTTIVSRFGVMFFDDPVAAFANLRAAATPGATLAFVCWRGLDENAMFTLGTSLLHSRLDPPPTPPLPGALGPMALADGDRTRSLLGAAGWADVAVTAFDAVCDYGHNGSDGVEERLTMILGTSTGRAASRQLEPQLGPAGWAELLDDVRAELRRHLIDGRVQFTGATWLVTARNPD